MTSKNIKAHYRRTGIWPENRAAIPSYVTGPSKICKSKVVLVVILLISIVFILIVLCLFFNYNPQIDPVSGNKSIIQPTFYIYTETFYMVHIHPTYYIHTNLLFGTNMQFWWRYIKLCWHIRHLHIATNLVDGKEMYFWCRYIKLCWHIRHLHIVTNILYSTHMEFW